METYVVHIHRRPQAGGGEDTLAGVVERTDATVVRPFAGVRELLALLDIAPARGPAEAARDRRPSQRSKE